ncbi:MAG: AAA family ATPase, partial [Microbacterium gubbeenense]
MARSIYITSAEGHSGKSTIALGVLDSLSRVSPRVGVFRTIARSVTEPDYVLEMLLDHDGTDLDYADCIGVTYDDVRADPEGALAEIVARFKRVEDRCDAVVVLGSDYTDVGSPAELAYNARIAANLGTPVLLVLGGRKPQGHVPELGSAAARSPRDMEQLASLAVAELGRANAELAATIVNRADASRAREIVDAVRERTPGSPVWAIPEDRLLVAPTMADILRSVDGEVVKGDDALLAREALGVTVAAMSMVNILPRLGEGHVVIIPADRS